MYICLQPIYVVLVLLHGGYKPKDNQRHAEASAEEQYGSEAHGRYRGVVTRTNKQTAQLKCITAQAQVNSQTQCYTYTAPCFI